MKVPPQIASRISLARVAMPGLDRLAVELF
jgi:hypothetical protein